MAYFVPGVQLSGKYACTDGKLQELRVDSFPCPIRKVNTESMRSEEHFADPAAVRSAEAALRTTRRKIPFPTRKVLEIPKFERKNLHHLERHYCRATVPPMTLIL